MKKNYIAKSKLPNYLTLARILSIFPFILLALLGYLSIPYLNSSPITGTVGRLLFNISNWFVFAIFILSMITDYVDGWYARKYNCVTENGKLWDPLADKIITTSTLIYLTVIQFVPFWIVIIIVVRDLIVDGHRVIMAKNQLDVKASFLGKLKTMVVSIGIVITLFIYNILNTVPQSVTNWHPLIEKIGLTTSLFGYYSYIFNIVLLAGMILSVISGVDYVLKLRRHIRRQNKMRNEKK